MIYECNNGGIIEESTIEVYGGTDSWGSKGYIADGT